MKMIRFLLVVILLLVTTGIATAEYMTLADVRYDAREYPDLFYHRGGAQGHSGAYIQVLAGIVQYSDLTQISIKAKHLNTDFEVSLVELDQDCVGVWQYLDEAEQWFSIWLKPDYTWMTGDWEITLKYKAASGKGTETKIVTVPRFNFPPEPSGIQISEYEGQTWIAWNSIGEPGTYLDGKHLEYRLLKMTPTPAACPDRSKGIRPGRYEYQMWSGNRIAVPLPEEWGLVAGDLIRIENRVYDDYDGVYRFDRGMRYFFMR
jgi:hypothetical protein